MNQILSQSEVDALLAAVTDGDVPAGGAGGGGSGGSSNVKSINGGNLDKNVISYDLTSQDRIIRGRLPQLEVIYEKFMRSFRVSLSASLRKIASITLTSTEFLKFGEFINTLPIPTCMSVLRFNNLRGSALFVIEAKLAYALVGSPASNPASALCVTSAGSKVSDVSKPSGTIRSNVGVRMIGAATPSTSMPRS